MFFKVLGREVDWFGRISVWLRKGNDIKYLQQFRQGEQGKEVYRGRGKQVVSCDREKR